MLVAESRKTKSVGMRKDVTVPTLIMDSTTESFLLKIYNTSEDNEHIETEVL